MSVNAALISYAGVTLVNGLRGSGLIYVLWAVGVT